MELQRCLVKLCIRMGTKIRLACSQVIRYNFLSRFWWNFLSLVEELEFFFLWWDDLAILLSSSPSIFTSISLQASSSWWSQTPALFFFQPKSFRFLLCPLSAYVEGKRKVKVAYLTSVAKQAKTAFLQGPTVWKSPIVTLSALVRRQSLHRSNQNVVVVELSWVVICFSLTSASSLRIRMHMCIHVFCRLCYGRWDTDLDLVFAWGHRFCVCYVKCTKGLGMLMYWLKRWWPASQK